MFANMISANMFSGLPRCATPSSVRGATVLCATSAHDSVGAGAVPDVCAHVCRDRCDTCRHEWNATPSEGMRGHALHGKIVAMHRTSWSVMYCTPPLRCTVDVLYTVVLHGALYRWVSLCVCVCVHYCMHVWLLDVCTACVQSFASACASVAVGAVPYTYVRPISVLRFWIILILRGGIFMSMGISHRF